MVNDLYVRFLCFFFINAEMGGGRTLMRKREAWLFPLHDFFNRVNARIFETSAKWPAGSTPFGLCLCLMDVILGKGMRASL